MDNLTPHINKNKDVIIYVDGSLIHRDDAKISVFDSGFMSGTFTNAIVLCTQWSRRLHHHVQRHLSSCSISKLCASSSDVRAAHVLSRVEELADGVHFKLSTTNIC